MATKKTSLHMGRIYYKHREKPNLVIFPQGVMGKICSMNSPLPTVVDQKFLFMPFMFSLMFPLPSNTLP